jgi:hypothetical protein
MTIIIYRRRGNEQIAVVTAESAWVAIHMAAVFAIPIYRWRIQP